MLISITDKYGYYQIIDTNEIKQVYKHMPIDGAYTRIILKDGTRLWSDQAPSEIMDKINNKEEK